MICAGTARSSQISTRSHFYNCRGFQCSTGRRSCGKRSIAQKTSIRSGKGSLFATISHRQCAKSSYLISGAMVTSGWHMSLTSSTPPAAECAISPPPDACPPSGPAISGLGGETCRESLHHTYQLIYRRFNRSVYSGDLEYFYGILQIVIPATLVTVGRSYGSRGRTPTNLFLSYASRGHHVVIPVRIQASGSCLALLLLVPSAVEKTEIAVRL